MFCMLPGLNNHFPHYCACSENIDLVYHNVVATPVSPFSSGIYVSLSWLHLKNASSFSLSYFTIHSCSSGIEKWNSVGKHFELRLLVPFCEGYLPEIMSGFLEEHSIHSSVYFLKLLRSRYAYSKASCKVCTIFLLENSYFLSCGHNVLELTISPKGWFELWTIFPMKL